MAQSVCWVACYKRAQKVCGYAHQLHNSGEGCLNTFHTFDHQVGRNAIHIFVNQGVIILAFFLEAHNIRTCWAFAFCYAAGHPDLTQSVSGFFYALIAQAHVSQHECILHGACKNGHDVLIAAHQRLQLGFILDVANTEWVLFINHQLHIATVSHTVERDVAGGFKLSSFLFGYSACFHKEVQ